MKLVKLSLAAIVAVGAMTTFASAKPLEEAIKGVEVSGFARYRFHYNDGEIADNKNEKQRNRFTGIFNLTSPVTDDLKFGMTAKYDTKEFAQNTAVDVKSGFAITDFWFQYAISDFTIKAGKIAIQTPWTDGGSTGNKGNGIVATYKGLEGFTFAGAYFNQTDIKPKNTPYNLGEEDLYAAGAIGKIGPVGIAVWGAKMEHAIDWAAFAEASINIDGFNARAQVNSLKLDKDVQLDNRRGMFYGAVVGYKDKQFNFDLGYTKNSKKQRVYAFKEGSDSHIQFGKQMKDITTNDAGARVIFANAGFKYEKFGFDAGYGFSNNGLKNTQKVKMNEVYGQVSYNYAKNFGLQLYYSVLDVNSNAKDNNELRFQAQYKF